MTQRRAPEKSAPDAAVSYSSNLQALQKTSGDGFDVNGFLKRFSPARDICDRDHRL
jgi:hypothetical protein